MNANNNMNFAKGMGVGLMVGSAVGMLVTRKKKPCKSPVGKALRTVGEMMESISGAMGM